ncbi:hypothetical protein BN59_02464 [Legionella massiliensis]|uniref:DUF2892 domain-containing protein n=1 Tax=Legionella massiliensis TaxID=1034943 RepID=A0A078KYK4_9GAMM|nr:hypothetical protein BN59_02464 [Legionella massiliensis]CEE13895.1 hypothetical protein BN1094_02464 [Legionella massiliensis]
MSFTCNIDKTDRINRTIIGAALCIAALFEMEKFSYIALGLALIMLLFATHAGLTVIL